MPRVTVRLSFKKDGKEHAVSVSEETDGILKEAAEFFKRAKEWFLELTFEKFGMLSEEKILCVVDRKVKEVPRQ